MTITEIPVDLNPGDNFVPHEWTTPRAIRAHVTLPPPGPPAPGCDYAMGVQLTQAIVKNGAKGLTIKYQSPNGQPLTGGTLVVFEP